MSGLSRRLFLASSTSLGGAAGLPLAGCATAPAASPTAATPAASPPAPRPSADLASMKLEVNGTVYELGLDPRVTLLDALRDHIGLTGTKKGCDQGQCGACTVHLDGRRVLSCLTLAASVGGRKVKTIEGLAGSAGKLHPMQQAFVDHDAFQCGYCTPGQIMSAVACVDEGHAGTRSDIREYMSGNICRCAAYSNIVDAVEQARRSMGAA